MWSCTTWKLSGLYPKVLNQTEFEDSKLQYAISTIKAIGYEYEATESEPGRMIFTRYDHKKDELVEIRLEKEIDLYAK
jgi:hypothetical protein